MSNLASNQQTMELNEDNEDTTYQRRLIHCALYSIERDKHAFGQCILCDASCKASHLLNSIDNGHFGLSPRYQNSQGIRAT